MSQHSATSVFRVDKFVVPAGALATFVEQMQHIQRLLRTQPGCVRATVLKQTGGSGEFNVLTLVEWESDAAVAAAQEAVQQKFAQEGFDPKAFAQGLGARSDLGFYAQA